MHRTLVAETGRDSLHGGLLDLIKKEEKKNGYASFKFHHTGDFSSANNYNTVCKGEQLWFLRHKMTAKGLA